MKYWKIYKTTVKTIALTTIIIIGLLASLALPSLHQYEHTLFYASMIMTAISLGAFGQLIKEFIQKI